jgi:hypothetical protein
MSISARFDVAGANSASGRELTKKHHGTFVAVSPIRRSLGSAAAEDSSMSFDMELDDDLSERRLRRLELRYRSAQTALAEARALYASLHEMPGANDLQRHQAQQRVQRAMRQMAEIQRAIDLLEDQDWGTPARQ